MQQKPRSRPGVFAILALIVSLLAASGSALAAPTRAGAAPADGDRCAGLHPATVSMGGVVLDLCLPLLPGPFVEPPRDGAAQVATSVSLEPFYEVSITAVAFGSRAPTEALPAARPGGETAYRAALRKSREDTGTYLREGPTARLFGKEAGGSVSLASLEVNRQGALPILITEWVVEAEGRIWIIRVAQEDSDTVPIPARTVQMLAPLSALSVESRGAALAPAPAGPPDPDRVARPDTDPSPYADLPAPAWWDGDCDANHYAQVAGQPAYPLGGTFRGLKACGPRPWFDGAPDVLVRFFPGAWGAFEWECVELSMRYLYLAYGIPPYGANGKDVVNNYRGDLLVKVSNGEVGKAPQPGDVLSLGPTTTYGHTVVATASTVDGSGNGTIEIIDQNSGATGRGTYSVRNWEVKTYSTVSGWLHAPAALNGIALEGRDTGSVSRSYTFTASAGPVNSTLPVAYTWQATGLAPVTHVRMASLKDTVTFTWSTPGAKTVTVTATNAGGVVTASRLVTIQTQVPTQLVLTPSRTILFADGSSKTEVAATLHDAIGEPMAGQSIAFATSAGTLSAASAATDYDGTSLVTLTSSDQPGTAALTATAGSLSASAQVQFVPFTRYWLPVAIGTENTPQ